jgi:hypothetical protein
VVVAGDVLASVVVSSVVVVSPTVVVAGSCDVEVPTDVDVSFDENVVPVRRRTDARTEPVEATKPAKRQNANSNA